MTDEEQLLSLRQEQRQLEELILSKRKRIAEIREVLKELEPKVEVARRKKEWEDGEPAREALRQTPEFQVWKKNFLEKEEQRKIHIRAIFKKEELEQQSKIYVLLQENNSPSEVTVCRFGTKWFFSKVGTFWWNELSEDMMLIDTPDRTRYLKLFKEEINTLSLDKVLISSETINVFELLKLANMSSSNKESKRILSEKSLKIDDSLVTENLIFIAKDIEGKLLSRGKKKKLIAIEDF